MEYVAVLVIAALVFGACFCVDKLFVKIFRNQSQHRSGKAVRLNKHYGSFGLILAVLGLAAVFVGLSDGWVLIAGGCMVILIGAGLVVYYMTFGVFYDEKSFLLTHFGKGSVTYAYSQIQGQKLYNNGGNILIELYMTDGRAIQLPATMTGVYEFMDTAFDGWLAQTGKRREDCDFYNPQQSCWFPNAEG